MDLPALFLTGLLTGGITCMAVQGGLLTATLARQSEEQLARATTQSGKVFPVLSFILAKLLIYTLLGLLLGWVGSFFRISLTLSIILQFAVVLFMFGTVMHLLKVHPIFRYFILQPPQFVLRFMKRYIKRHDVFAPFVVGLLTVFLPCGVTQSVMALAIASGDPVSGALMLFLFTLGTSPLFFLVGFFTLKAGEVFKKSFAKIAALSILLFALYNLNAALSLTGMVNTPARVLKNIYCVFAFCDDSIAFSQRTKPVTSSTIRIQKNGYSPNTFSVKAGSPVTLQLVNDGGNGCTQSFAIPRLGIQKVVPLGQTASIQFTAPEKPQELAFMCSMGMYSGTIHVI